MSGQRPNGQPGEAHESDADAAARSQELERSIGELRVAVAELREQQIEILEQLDGRIAQLRSRTNHLNHLVQGILNSRMWRTLMAAGGVLIAAKAGGRRRAPAAGPQ